MARPRMELHSTPLDTDDLVRSVVATTKAATQQGAPTPATFSELSSSRRPIETRTMNSSCNDAPNANKITEVLSLFDSGRCDTAGANAGTANAHASTPSKMPIYQFIGACGKRVQ